MNIVIFTHNLGNWPIVQLSYRLSVLKTWRRAVRPCCTTRLWQRTSHLHRELHS